MNGLHNNLLDGCAQSTCGGGEEIALWRDIVDLYEADADDPEFKILNKLTDKHAYSDKVKKLKCSHAC